LIGTREKNPAFLSEVEECLMVGDEDIYRAAAGLNKNYGDDAHFACVEIAEK
jgi:hypothetical protein